MRDSRPTHRRRLSWKWALTGGFVVSLFVNLAVAVKIIVFDPNYPFRPICFAGRHVGLVALNGPVTREFKVEILEILNHARWNASGENLYISRRSWWNERGVLWNQTRQVAEFIHKKRTGQPLSQIRSQFKTNSCKFIRKYALKKPTEN